jgi:phospholipid/cholesterol/gamma-HCH transport system substrate-binding protein
METKANFVLIGAVSVLGILGLLGLLVWFAKVEIDRQYAVYEVLFESVSGLGMAADVRYNGLSVGKVIGLELDAEDPGKVRVRIEVAADTPIKTDTSAQLNSQGVTGVAYVALTGGSPDTPLLRESADAAEVPLIPAQRSVVQALTEDAPDLVTEAVETIKDIRSFLGPENREAVSALLRNLENASGQLDAALTDFSDISRHVSEGAAQISNFTGRLDEIGTTVQTTLSTANETLEVAKVALADIEPTLKSATAAFTAAETTIGNIDEIVQTRVRTIAEDLNLTIRSIEGATNDLHGQLGDVLTRFGGTADVATNRFTELETTIADLDLTLSDARASLAAVESASVYFQELVDGEGSALVQDARTTLADVKESLARLDGLLQEDFSAIVADVRQAVASANAVVDRVAVDVTAFTKQLDPLVLSGEATLQAATETLHNANRSLGNLDQALSTTETTLDVARRAFSEAETAITTDLGPAVRDIRTAAGQFESTLAALSSDIPAITADLRNATARTLEVVEEIGRTVEAGAPPIEDFARTGLPEFTNFAREAQRLIYRLDLLAKKLERDPARFFFGNSVPVFGR